MPKNLIPQMLDALRPQLPDVAKWVGVSIWVARDWQMANRQPKPEKRAALVKATRKHAKELLALADRVEREAKTTRRK